MAKMLTLKQAREAALAGNIELALPVLEAKSDLGVGSASAILAQIRAYRGDWDGVIEAATRLLANPSDIRAGNVTDEAKWLLLRAGHETGRWVDVASAVKKQPPLSEGFTDVIGKHIAKQARAKGKLRDPAYAAVDVDTRKLAAREQDFADAMADCEVTWKKRKPRRGERETATWDYAIAYQLDDRARASWPAAQAYATWDAAVDAARLFARAKRPAKSARILEQKVAQFWPVDVGQAVPVEPIVDEVLWRLITDRLRARLLRTPKGKD